MAHVSRLRIHPVKSLPGVERDAAGITSRGTLALDREYAFFGDDGEVVNGKRTDRVHDLDVDFDAGTHALTVFPDDGEQARFELGDQHGRDAAAAWFGEFFGFPVTLRRDETGGFVDRPDAGPSVVSTATLEEVASWYEDVTVSGLRRRIRANVEVDGVPAFWEDQFVGEGAPAFEAGDVRIEGVKPCGRCVVPERDPDTGERSPVFRRRLVEKRQETLPEWVDEDAFEHYYALMLIAQVPEAYRGQTIRVGDEVRVVDE